MVSYPLLNYQDNRCHHNFPDNCKSIVDYIERIEEMIGRKRDFLKKEEKNLLG